jgi:CopG family nickel-responsive transcriptional regulator
MSELLRFGVSAEDNLLQSFDGLIAGQGYANRSEALRDLMRDALVRARLEDHKESGDALGSLTLVYDHHAHDLADRMAEVQHDHHEMVVSVLHVHISPDDCMEVIVLRGDVRRVRDLSDSLLSLKGVKHGRLFITVPSKAITERAGTAHARRHSGYHPREINK